MDPAGRQPAMGPCTGDPHLGGASWLLGLTSLLLSVCSTGTQRSEAHGSGVEDSGNPISLKGMQGASVLFQVLRNPDLPAGVELENMTWGILSGANYTILLQVSPGARDPEWVNFQDKFQKRVRVLNITTLRMNNLTPEDTGLYRARGFYSRGRQYDQDFHLTVYEPLPLPQIRTTNLSITPGWCNVTVQCDAPGTREDLTMSWESRGLPRELEQREATGPAPNPWTLALSLPLSQPSASLTCVLRNQVDQTTATLDLGDICGHDPQGQSYAPQLPTILRVVVVLLLILGAGLFLWRTRVKKSLEPGRGRLHFSSPGPHTSLPWTLGSLPPAFTAQGMSLQEAGGGGHGLGVIEGKVQVQGSDFSCFCV
ncbi:SLAM family member 9-like isoform X2 [Canis lupus familiaris]|uniref:SLAM family member 9-like isoform X2 n=1 Tax=Canis lupus familiaris TaxID=9615 RepID=UPI0018F7DC72|nr:SLAM family member 9-like isoform X2 [Canis lupus familiaris]